MPTKKPRVAAIGLDDSQNEAIEWLCGEMRVATSVEDYLQEYSWTETDVAVGYGFEGRIGSGVHLLLIAPHDFQWHGYPVPGHQSIGTDPDNTEREVKVSSNCPKSYRELAEGLVVHTEEAANPPRVLSPWWDDGGKDYGRFWKGGASTFVLVETTSHFPLAVRHVRMYLIRHGIDADVGESIVLALAQGTDLPGWFRAFLHDVHKTDPGRVPLAPPRLAKSSEWYTPQERGLAKQIATVEEEAARLKVEQKRLLAERGRLEGELRSVGEDADKGIRSVIWVDGDDLVRAVEKILTGLGFKVQDMDAEWEPGEAKREDLRLTLDSHPGWEAIVEVKGYKRGTRTNDARQIREHRDRYIAENNESPDLTLWIANPHRNRDPSSRLGPDNNVRETAEFIETVHVLTTDLYRQWALVVNGNLDASDVVQHLISSPPGLWEPVPVLLPRRGQHRPLPPRGGYRSTRCP